MATAQPAHPVPRLISVVIPVRNGAETLGEQLDALARQTYGGPFEVIVVDNGSTDGTPRLAEQWRDRLPALTVIDASDRPGSSYARNVGARRAEGDFLAFCDADDVVAPEWLASLAGGAQMYDVVTGPQDVTRINPESVQRWRPPRPATLSIGSGRFMPFAPSCNLGVWADVFARTGDFKEDYPQAHDVDWSWRAQFASFNIGFSPDAVVHYRYRTSPRGVLRQAYVTGLDAARLYRDYRARGMKRPPLSFGLRRWAWLVVRLPYLASTQQRGIWLRRAGEASGRLAGAVKFHIVFL